MAIADHLQDAPHGIAQRAHAVVENVKDRIARSKTYRATLRDLSALSDRELADLGISRSMIQPLAKEAAKAA